MIIHTKTPDELREAIAGFKKKGYIRVDSRTCADWHENAENFIYIDVDLKLWSYCSTEMAWKFGFVEYLKSEGV